MSLQTDHNGQVVYQVPEDATPGRSLNIAMPSRSEDLPAVVDVLHPLNFDTTTRQAPRLDRTNPLMTLGKRTMVVDGHNFDGMAQNNRIIIDGALEAQIIAASPVQLRFTVPAGTLRPGPHSLVVSCEGMRSNPVPFEFAAAEIPADAQNGKDGSKLTVKVLGTASKVNVKIINLSPDIVRLSHDQDADITSTGGADNKAVVSLQRIKKGTYKLQAEIVL
ncbi:MAG: IPT/TIG domain-containing protein [Candidatus Obscuribacter sp.]|nr:IPT/TIG domain-containing protein [Candidatus Obscuribacter sp.]